MCAEYYEMNQYAIAFLDKKSLIKAINLHKRTICSISGSYFRYFGFKNLDEVGENFVDDLYGFIDLRTSETYTRLCKALGRPTLLQMAFRAVRVLLEQGDVEGLTAAYDARWRENHAISNSRYRTRAVEEVKVPPFLKKLNKFMDQCRKNGIDNTKPRNNDLYRKYAKFDTFSKRVNYLKTLTNTLLSDHMESKGWDNKKPGCRFKNCDNKTESLQHVMTHIQAEGSKSAAKSISKSINAEKRMKREVRMSYDIVRLNASAAELIAEEISGQKAPTFKIRKKEKTNDQNTNKKKRRVQRDQGQDQNDPRPRKRRQK